QRPDHSRHPDLVPEPRQARLEPAGRRIRTGLDDAVRPDGRRAPARPSAAEGQGHRSRAGPVRTAARAEPRVELRFLWWTEHPWRARRDRAAVAFDPRDGRRVLAREPLGGAAARA